MKKTKFFLCLWLCLLSAGVSLFVTATTAFAQTFSHETIRVTDATGRTVEIEKPLTRVVTINSAAAIIMRALGVDIRETIVGVTSYVTDKPAFWPELTDKPAFQFNNVSYERLAELNPQLVIFHKNSNLHTHEEKLGAIGTRWLYLDCNDSRSIDDDVRLLGSLFGREEQAEELIAWRQEHERNIEKRIQTIKPENRARVFYYSAVDYYLDRNIYRTMNRRSSSHALVTKAGGINIAAHMPWDSRNVGAEWIAQMNPGVIIADAVNARQYGYHADEAEALENFKELHRKMLSDPALRITEAGMNDRILLIALDLNQGPASIVGIAHIARWLYPELFKDMDPTAILEEYHEKWCELPHRGVFVYPPLPQVTEIADSR